jgi:hypothetical protein
MLRGAVLAPIAAALLVSSQAATAVVQLSPVATDGTLEAGYTVAHHYSGARCQRGSAMTGTAYRCFTPQSSGVYDPCWVTQSSSYVVCLGRPWKHGVVQLHVTGGYDDSDPFHHHGTPWGVRLTDGNHCLFEPGSVNSIGGRSLRYYCNHHVVLAGSFDRSHQQWRIRSYRNTTPHATDATYHYEGRARVATAWFGLSSRQD